MFHVSCLKKKVVDHVTPLSPLSPVDLQEELVPNLETILQYHSGKVNNRSLVEVLVQWTCARVDDSTWEAYWQLCEKFLHLVGKVL